MVKASALWHFDFPLIKIAEQQRDRDGKKSCWKLSLFVKKCQNSDMICFRVRAKNPKRVLGEVCFRGIGNKQLKRYISARAKENSKHVKPKLLWMDFFDSKCFQYGVNHCKTTFISCLCLSKEGWDTKLPRLVCSVQASEPSGEMRSSQTRKGHT